MKRTPRRRSACRSCISEGALSDTSCGSTKSTPVSANESVFKKPELSNTQFTSSLGGMQVQLNNDKKFMFVDTDETVIYGYKEGCFREDKEKKEKLPTYKLTGKNGVEKSFRDPIKCKSRTKCISLLLVLLIILFLYCYITNLGNKLSKPQHLSEHYRKEMTEESVIPVDDINNDISENRADGIGKYTTAAIKNILITNEQLYKEMRLWRRQQTTFKMDLLKLKLSSKLMKHPKEDITAEWSERKGCCSKLQSSSCCMCPCDEVNMPDFALESSGGNIVSTPQTETLQPDSWYYILGIPMWKHTRSPRSIIQNSVAPGECWPFHGASGSVVIQLAASIIITAVTMEHIPATMSLTGKIDSAPNTFSVYGLKTYNEEGDALGSFQYNISGSPLQTFLISQQLEVRHGPFSAVKLWITSNHGNPVYTCIYRFRVHGSLYSERKVIS